MLYAYKIYLSFFNVDVLKFLTEEKKLYVQRFLIYYFFNFNDIYN